MFPIQASLISVSLIALLCWYLLRRRERAFSDVMLAGALAACGLLEAAHFLGTLYPLDPRLVKGLVLSAEGCLPLAWVLYAQTFARERGPNPLPPKNPLARASFLFPPVAVALFLWYVGSFRNPHAENLLLLGRVEFGFHLIFLFFLVAALINLEATLSSASYGASWRIKPEIVGAGSILAFLVFFYSQELFYRSCAWLLPVRSAVLIAAAGLILYSRMTRGGGVCIRVSRQMAYNSVVFLAVGVYLLGLGLLGEGSRLFGASFSRSFRITVAFIAGMGLVSLLLSDRFRRCTKVFLHKNFYRNKYDYRVQWLQFTDRLACARGAEEYLQAVLSGFVEIFGMRYGALFVLEPERGGYCATAWFELTTPGDPVPPSEPFVQYLQQTRRVIRVSDPIPGVPPHLCSRAPLVFIVPLMDGDSLEGFIALGRALNPEERYNYEDFDLMKTLGRQAVSGLLNIRYARQLSASREMETVGRIAAFLVHDLKNLTSSISMLVDNAKEQMDCQQFRQEMLQSLSGSVSKMKGLIMKLKGVGECKKTGRREEVDLLEVVKKAVSPLAGKGVKVMGAPVTVRLDPADVQTLTLNLVLNAIEACQGNGDVVVEVGKDETPYFTVTDNGCGIHQEYLNHELFQPFRTTKRKGLGIGLYQCRQIVTSYGGKIEVKSKVGIGSQFTVLLPEDQHEPPEASVLAEPAGQSSGRRSHG